MNKKSIRIVIIFFILICLATVIIYINLRRYVNFTYIAESEYTNLDYFDDYNFPDDCQFTWWWHFPSETAGTIEFIDEKFGTKFNEKLDYNIDVSKVDIIISFGRKLKTIYYDEKIFTNGEGYYSKDMIIAVPVFEEEYEPKIYLYVTDKKYKIYPAEFANNDIENFNRYGKVRFNEE